MRGFIAIARREIVERRGILVAAGIMAFLPFLSPLLPAARRFGASETRLYTAASLAVAISGAFSFLLGSAIGREITDKRLGFFFARPVGNNAIWAGRLAGGWLLAVGAALLVLLPAGLFDLATWTREARSGLAVALAGAFAFAVLVFLALGNAANLVLRSRSAWAAGDLAALVLWAILTGAGLLPLAADRAPQLLGRLGVAIAAACALALLASIAAQVSIGRADSERGNRARFLVLWGLLLAVAGATFGSVRWLLKPSAKQLSSAWVGAAAPSGSWIEVEGRARGRVDLWSSFFFDVASRRTIRAGAGRIGGAVLSQDGSAAAWTGMSYIGPEERREVWTCRLAPGAVPVHTSISALYGRIAISQDGTRLAAAQESALGIYELPSGRLLGSIALDEDERFSRFVFIGRDRLRLYRIPSAGTASVGEALGTIEVSDYDAAGRRIRSATIANVHRPFALAFEDRGGRLLVWERGSAVSLFDVSDGRLVAVLGNFGWDAASRAFLSDGRIAVGETSGGVGRVHLYSPDGQAQKVLEVGAGGLISLGGEVSPGILAVALGPTPYVAGVSDSFLLNLGDGRLTRIARHLEPVAGRLRWRLPRPEPGSVAARLFFDGNGALLLMDPATAKLTTLLPER
jgi:hypothetical protein